MENLSGWIPYPKDDCCGDWANMLMKYPYIFNDDYDVDGVTEIVIVINGCKYNGNNLLKNL